LQPLAKNARRRAEKGVSGRASKERRQVVGPSEGEGLRKASMRSESGKQTWVCGLRLWCERQSELQPIFTLWYRPSNYRQPPGARLPRGYWKTRRLCTVNNAAIGIHGAWGVSDVALSDGPLLPPTAPQTHGRVHTQLHKRAGCACADPVPRNVAHACRGPRKSGRHACPVAGRASGTRAMAQGEVSADPRGSCHQPRRYHVRLSYTWLRRPILLGGARHAATVESTPLLSITVLTLGFITVYVTCTTTVASRVAANACDTHLRFLPRVPESSSSP
jgi:hypothetical protein